MKQMPKPPASEVVMVLDPTGLTGADWAEMDKLRNAYDAGGHLAFLAALHTLEQKAASEEYPATQATETYFRVLNALSPGLAREVLRECLAERGITKEDLAKRGMTEEDLLRKIESNSLIQRRHSNRQ
jgi:hypothetical protein